MEQQTTTPFPKQIKDEAARWSKRTFFLSLMNLAGRVFLHAFCPRLQSWTESKRQQKDIDLEDESFDPILICKIKRTPTTGGGSV